MADNFIDIEQFIEEKGLTLIKTNDGETYVVHGLKLYLTNSQYIEDMLFMEHKHQLSKTPKKQQLKDYIHHIEVLARQSSNECQLHLRVAKEGQDFYYDLGEEVVKVETEGWQTITTPPVYFKRHGNMAQQIAPQQSGDVKLKEVLDFVNLADDNSQTLFMVYLVTCFVSDIAHPIPVFHGEKGAAKSTVLRLLRKLVDPAKQELTVLPRSQNELAQVIAHNYMPAFDNLGKLSNNVSDLLCCAVTGGAVHKRKLYTDMEDIVIPVKSCITLNGVNLMATRSDLLDRTLLFEVKRIEEEHRQTEGAFWTSFEEKRPFILGAIFNVLAGAMKIMASDLPIERLPRMADFAKWGYAIAEAAGIGGGNFLNAYRNNISLVNDEVVASDPVADAIVSLIDQQDSWRGYATELLNLLIAQNPTYNFPKLPNALSKHLKEITSNLRAKNITCTFSTDTNSNKTRIELKRIDVVADTSVTPVELAGEAEQHANEGSSGDTGDESSEAA